MHYNCVTAEGSRDTWREHIDISFEKNTYRAVGPYPQCRNCSVGSRPNVWFCHDSDYVQSSETAEISSQYSKWIEKLEEEQKAVCVIEIGCGLVIPSGRIEAELMCEQLPNATLIRVNPSDYMVPGPPVDTEYEAIGIPLGAMAGMTRILKSVKEQQI
jgi:hypothetical protein